MATRNLIGIYWQKYVLEKRTAKLALVGSTPKSEEFRPLSVKVYKHIVQTQISLVDGIIRSGCVWRMQVLLYMYDYRLRAWYYSTGSNYSRGKLRWQIAALECPWVSAIRKTLKLQSGEFQRWQGGPLACILSWRVSFGTVRITDLDFADDAVIFAEATQVILEAVTSWMRQLSQFLWALWICKSHRRLPSLAVIHFSTGCEPEVRNGWIMYLLETCRYESNNHLNLVGISRKIATERFSGPSQVGQDWLVTKRWRGEDRLHDRSMNFTIRSEVLCTLILNACWTICEPRRNHFFKWWSERLPSLLEILSCLEKVSLRLFLQLYVSDIHQYTCPLPFKDVTFLANAANDEYWKNITGEYSVPASDKTTSNLPTEIRNLFRFI